MAATREQLIARWETAEGRDLAEEVQLAVNPTRTRNLTSDIRMPFPDNLRQRLAGLPFVDEVAPRLDLRGVHTAQNDLFLIQIDLAGAHLEYARLGLIKNVRLDGAILDDCVAINSAFSGNLSQVSLAGATLNGVKFRKIDLTRSQLQGARLVKTELREAVCSEASFLGADLRFSDCLRADFRGADLREVDFTEASLKDIRFNEQTRLRGAKLQGAKMRDDFRAFAQQAGAQLGEFQNAQNFAELDVTIKMLQGSENPRMLAALPILRSVRADLARTPEQDWSDAVSEALANAGYSDLVEEVFDAWGDSGKAMGYYISVSG